MTISARSTPAVACIAAVLLLGCGGEEQETRTIVETVVPEQPSAPGPEQAPPTDQPPAQEPLPPGVVGADGTYTMTVRDSSHEGFRITSDDTDPEESEWTFSTSCPGSECEIDMRRELQSGGFKSLTLTPVGGREGAFETDTTGETACSTGRPEAPSDQRYSIKLNAPADVGGRLTATRIEAYFTEETDGCTDGGDRSRGAVSWTGVLAP
jgi:hypothetical protein